MSTKTYPAQILLISLLVLMIIAIIVVGVVGVASRDVLQTGGNQQYQKVYNATESTIFKVIDKYGDGGVDLTNLVSETFANGSCGNSGPSIYDCVFTEDDVVTKLNVTDTSEVKAFELGKDASLELNLSGYRGQIVMSWTGSAAIEFGLIYEDAGSSATRFIGDLFDTVSLYDASGNNPTQRTSPENHPFLFSTEPGGGINFNVNNILGLPASAKTLTLRLTARMDAAQAVIRVNVSGDSSFPKQIREFLATSYDTASDVQSTATVLTQVPLLPQAPAPLNYSLLTLDVVDKDLNP